MLHVRICNWQLKDFEVLYNISHMLAQYFPHPDQCVTGIYELLLNAIEHGNLGIGFDAKTELIRQGQWLEEVTRRLAMPENAGKEVEITLTCNQTECRLTIADQGGGFCWKDFAHCPPSGKQPNGRGLWIALNSKFDHIFFNPAGNEVTCVVEYCQ